VSEPGAAGEGSAGQDHVGDLAIVLHSHMPYVEGFGTYPFGEEWLFDAAIRSYARILPFVANLTMTVTPVLADQLEAPGVAGRLLEFTRSLRVASARRDEGEMQTAELRAACAAEAERYESVLSELERRDGSLLGAFAQAQDERNVQLIPSSATHAVLPLLATREAILMQLDTGIRSHARRFGPSAGFWMPECAYSPGLEHMLDEAGVRWTVVDQSAHEPAESALTPIAAGPLTAFPIDWEAVQWLWSMEGYPSDPLYADFHRKSLRGCRPWAISGEAYDAEAATGRAREQAEEFAAAVGGPACSPSPSIPSCWDIGGGRGRPGWPPCSSGSRRTAYVPCLSATRSRRTLPRPARCADPRGGRARTSAPGTPRRSLISCAEPGGSSYASSGRPEPGRSASRRWSAPRASCSRYRRATGPSSTTGARQATTPSSAFSTTAAACSRP
jgi:hypothetical protein